MSSTSMTLAEFNLRFLLALDAISPKLKHTSSGTGGNHPNLRRVLLRAAREDMQTDGLEATITKYQHFISPFRPLSPGRISNSERQ